METNRIVKTIILKAELDRVWRSISDSSCFGKWFGVAIDAPFVAGQEAIGQIVPTEVDPDVARLQEPYRGTPWRVRVEQILPMRLFSFRWHPFAVDSAHDYSAEPMTLVTFELDTVEDGVLLTITESGFDGIPLARRPHAIKANEGGWAHQAKLVERFLALNRD
jgi:uncharacterized protein YndB with AHSA1/START domain